jgi:glycosyltransferase involved in cell wall biosynthesis
VSVIIPAYNAGHTLAACLAALKNQTYPADRFEIIVVDDGSTDDTRAVAEAAGVQVVTIPHSGPAIARNQGAAVARGRFLLFTDADCVPVPEWLAALVRAVDQEGVVAAKGVYRTRQAGIIPRFVQLEFEEKYARMARQPFIRYVDTYSVAYRPVVFQQHGGFDPAFSHFRSLEDTELAFRLGQLGYRMVFAPAAAVYHTHAARLGDYLHKKFRYGLFYVQVFRRYPQRLVQHGYNPRYVQMQILLVGLLGLLTPLALRIRWARPVLALVGLAFGASCIPLLRLARRLDPALLPWVVPLSLARAGAQAAGLLVGLAVAGRNPKSAAGA